MRRRQRVIPGARKPAPGLSRNEKSANDKKQS
jgi:hypothetical protein